MEYYVNKLQKKIHKKIKKRLDLNETRLNICMFIKTFIKFFPTLLWTNIYEENQHKILHFQNLQGTGLVKIAITYFDIENFTNVIIILLSKNLNKPHSETLQGTINEKV